MSSLKIKIKKYKRENSVGEMKPIELESQEVEGRGYASGCVGVWVGGGTCSRVVWRSVSGFHNY